MKCLSQIDATGQKIVNVADPTASQDAATKNYVDTNSGGGGGTSGGDIWVVGEVPSGSINGVNQDFTIGSAYNKIVVWLNGMRQRVGVDYTASSSTTIHFISAPYTGDLLVVNYITTLVGHYWVVGEVPSGAINGSNQNFTTAKKFLSVNVFQNGLRLKIGVDYTLSGVNTIQFVTAPTTGDLIVVDYTTPPAGSWIIGEVPSGSINGTNQDFSTVYDFTKIEVYLNGLRMLVGTDYTVTDADTIHFLYAPSTGDSLLVDYTA